MKGGGGSDKKERAIRGRQENIMGRNKRREGDTEEQSQR